MSKVATIVGEVAGVVAFAASIALTAGATAVIGLSLVTVEAVASAVAVTSAAIAQATAKPPDMKGSVNQVLIGANMPVPYAMGRTYVGGNMMYDDSNGNVGDPLPNVDRTQIFVGSAAGPIEGFEAFQADYATIPTSPALNSEDIGVATDAWYGADDGYLWVGSRLGARPSSALGPFGGRAAFRGWSEPANRLSGWPAWSVTMEWDEDGKRWSGGIPAFGMIAKWVKVYDPRRDSTYPGGSGDHDWLTEGISWEYGSAGGGAVAIGENPALHALAYARGRWMSWSGGVLAGKMVGIGLTQSQINIARFVEFANLCDANGWVIGGTVYEGPGLSKWDNLKRICAAGGAKPVWSGGMLDLVLPKPQVALDTITAADLAGGPIIVPAMQGWRDRVNTIVPRYRSEPHRWDYVQSDAVTSSTYLDEDGETKTKEVQYDLVQDKDQAAQLAAYDLADGREFGPIRLNVKPRLILYRVGEALEIDMPEAGLSSQLAVIVGRSVDPATGAVQLSLRSETTAKHAWALGQTGTAPPTPSIADPGAVDQVASAQRLTSTQKQAILRSTYPKDLEATGEDDGTTARIDLTAFSFDYPEPYGDVAIGASSIHLLAFATTYYPFADVAFIGDPAPTFGATTVYGDSLNSAAHPNRIPLGRAVLTPIDGGTTTTGGGTGGGYTGGSGSSGRYPSP